MKYFEKLLLPLVSVMLLLSGCLLSGCEKEHMNTTLVEINSTDQAHASDLNDSGSAVRFSNNYDGFSELGQQETFEIDLIAHVNGILNVRLTSEAGVIEETETYISKSVSAGENLSIPVTIRLSNSGKFYINIQTDLEVNGRQQRSVFVVAVRTTSNKENQNKSYNAFQERPDVIVMPAQEEIIRKKDTD